MLALILALVLASLVKTRLKSYSEYDRGEPLLPPPVLMPCVYEGKLGIVADFSKGNQ